MNLKNVEVMENTQKTKQNRHIAPAAVGLGSLIAMSLTNAAIDTTAVVTEIGGLAAPIAAIGAAILLIFVGLKGWKLIRRAM